MINETSLSINKIDPYIRFANHFHLNEGFEFIDRRIYDHHFIYIVDGIATVKIENKTYTARRGCVFFWGPKTKHSLIVNKGTNLSMISIRFDFTQSFCKIKKHPLNSVIDKSYNEKEITEIIKFTDYKGFSTPLLIDNPEKAEEILTRLVSSYHQNSLNNQIKLKGLFLLFIYEIVSKKNLCSNNLPTIIRNLTSYLDKNYTHEIRIEMLSKMFGYNENHLNRLLKQYTNFTIHQYIINKRIMLAINLLNTTNLQVSQIAKMVGYDDTNYFSRVFKKKIGTSPSSYTKL